MKLPPSEVRAAQKDIRTPKENYLLEYQKRSDIDSDDFFSFFFSSIELPPSGVRAAPVTATSGGPESNGVGSSATYPQVLTYIYTYMYIPVYIFRVLHICRSLNISICMCINVYSCIYISSATYPQVLTYIYMYMYICIFLYIYIDVCIWVLHIRRSLNIFICVCIFLYIYFECYISAGS